MDRIMKLINDGQIIEAIKLFRGEYDCSLKLASDSVRSIKTAMDDAILNIAQFAQQHERMHNAHAEHIVFTREYNGSSIWTEQQSWSSLEAASEYANEIVDNFPDTVVVRVVQRSKTTKTMEYVG